MKQRPIDANKLKKIYMAKGKDKLKLSTVINELEMMPTIDHVKHGKWVYKPTSDHDGYIGCSNCDVHIPSCKIFQRNEYTNTSKYCPNCGARMDGE